MYYNLFKACMDTSKILTTAKVQFNLQGLCSEKSVKSIEKKYGFKNISIIDEQMIADPILDVRDQKILIPFKYEQPLKVSQGFQNTQFGEYLRSWLTIMYEHVSSDAFRKYHENELDEYQVKNYAAKNYLLNICKVMQKVKEGVTAQGLRTKIFKFINDESKKIIKMLKTRYPQTKVSAASIKLRNAISRPENNEMEKYDLLFNYRGVDGKPKLVFEFDKNKNYVSNIMRTLNYLISISSEPLQKEGDSLSKFQAFETMLSHIFMQTSNHDNDTNQKKGYSSQQEKVSKPFNEQEFRAMFVEDPQKNATQNVHDQQQSQLGYLENLKSLIRQLRNTRKDDEELVKFSINKKVPDGVQRFTEQEIEAGDFKITDGSLLRIITKWVEELREKLKQPEKHFLNRVELFKTKDGKLVQIQAEVKQMFYEQANIQERRIQAILKSMRGHFVRIQEQIMSYEYCNKYVNSFDTNIGIIAGHTEMCIGQYMAFYLNQVIHSLLSIPKQVAERIKRMINMPQMEQKRRVAKLIDLISFKIGDIVRGRCKGKQSEILRIYKRLEDVSENYPQILKMVRLKDRLKNSNKDILINFMFLEKIKCEVQLSITSNIKTAQKKLSKYNSFNHFIYELERSEFGPIAQSACIVAKNDPLISEEYQKLQSISQPKWDKENFFSTIIKREDINQFEIEYLLSPEQKCWPFFCNQCKKLCSNRNPDFITSRIHTLYYAECNSCAIRNIKCNESKVRLTSELFKQQYGTPEKADQLQKVMKHMEMINGHQDINTWYHLNKIGVLIAKNSNKPITLVYKLFEYQEDICFLVSARRLEQIDKITSNNLLPETLNAQYSNENPETRSQFLDSRVLFTLKKREQPQRMKSLLNSYYFFTSTHSSQFVVDENKRLIVLKCHCCTVKELPMSPNFQQLNVIEELNTEHIVKQLRNHKTILSLNNRMMKDELSKTAYCMSKIQRFEAENACLKSLEFISKIENVKVLKLGSNGISSFPQMLFSLRFLEEFCFQDNNVVSVHGIQNNLNLRVIKCNANNIKDISDISQCQVLQYLDIGSNFLSSICGIENCNNLKTLICSQNKLETLILQNQSRSLIQLVVQGNKLKTIKHLNLYPSLQVFNCSKNPLKGIDVQEQCLIKKLFISKNQLSDLKGVQLFPALEWLECVRNCLTSLLIDAKNSKLKKLVVSYNKITSLQGLQNMQELEQLACEQNSISSLKVKTEDGKMYQSRSLQSLIIGNNKLTSLEGLECFPSLTTLLAYENLISSIVQVQKHLSLRYMHIQLNPLQGLEGIQNFPELRRLLVQESSNKEHKIKSIQQLRACPLIQELDLSKNSISNLKGLQEQKFLVCLRCSENQLNSLAELQNCTRLQVLNLNSNNVINLQGIQKLNRLFQLSCSKNKISSILPLTNCFLLQNLQLSNNHISNFDDFASLRELKRLDLMENQIKNFQGVEQCKNLRELNINSCSTQDIQLMKKCPNLVKLHIQNQQCRDKLKGLKADQIFIQEKNPDDTWCKIPQPPQCCSQCHQPLNSVSYWCKWSHQQNHFKCKECINRPGVYSNLAENNNSVSVFPESYSNLAYKNNSVAVFPGFQGKVLSKDFGRNRKTSKVSTMTTALFKCSNCNSQNLDNNLRYICLGCGINKEKQYVDICFKCFDELSIGDSMTLENLNKKEPRHNKSHPFLRSLSGGYSYKDF